MAAVRWPSRYRSQTRLLTYVAALQAVFLCIIIAGAAALASASSCYPPSALFLTLAVAIQGLDRLVWLLQ